MSLKLPPTLPESEQAELLIKASSGDKAARNRLIEHNLRFAMFYANKFNPATQHIREDLFSIAVEGLIKAVDTFNPEMGKPFAAYAGKCMTNSILMSFRKKTVITCPIDNRPTPKRNQGLSEAFLSSFVENIEDPTQSNPMKALEDAELNEALQEAVNGLKPIDRMILCLYTSYNCDRAYTQYEISQLTGISQSYVCRVLRSILRNMRESGDWYS